MFYNTSKLVRKGKTISVAHYDQLVTSVHVWMLVNDATHSSLFHIWRPLLPYECSYKASCARPRYAVICNFLHMGTLTLSLERQSARLSKITNDGLTPCGTACFIAGNSGRQRIINGSRENRRVTVWCI